MARIEKRVTSKQRSVIGALPFTKINYQIFAVGIICIVLGYIALAQEQWDGTMPLVVAPILLVLGYCVIIPFGILFRKRSTETTVVEQQADTQAENSR
jgi:phosphotransferase system  glucose/maltose/N-acetylglucosamine-specific IIC component